jgi:hypothetical protein
LLRRTAPFTKGETLGKIRAGDLARVATTTIEQQAPEPQGAGGEEAANLPLGRFRAPRFFFRRESYKRRRFGPTGSGASVASAAQNDHHFRSFSTWETDVNEMNFIMASCVTV